MSEAQSLFALVVFVYALECLVVIRRGELVAVSLAGPRHRVVTHCTISFTAPAATARLCSTTPKRGPASSGSRCP